MNTIRFFVRENALSAARSITIPFLLFVSIAFIVTYSLAYPSYLEYKERSTETPPWSAEINFAFRSRAEVDELSSTLEEMYPGSKIVDSCMSESLVSVDSEALRDAASTPLKLVPTRLLNQPDRQVFFDIIQFFYNFCHDWGLAIIIVTIIFRIIVAPLMHKQAKSNYAMQKVQPKIQALKDRFPDDPTRQSQEMQKIYAEMKFNPLAGCLPMLLQMPIFIALFQVLREMGDRIGEGTYSFYNLVPNLVTTPSQAFGEGFGTFVPYLILMIIFAGATFLPMVLQQLKTENTQQKNQTLMMGAIMSLMMLWISWGSPAGVLLFWGASSLIGIGQNQLTLARCRAADRRKEEEEALVVKPIEVNVTRKEKKKRPKKKR